MKRWVALLGLVVFAIVGLRTVILALASDEARIRWAIEDMIEGYQEGDVGDSTEYLAREWTHEEAPGIDVEYLKQGMRGRYLTDRQEGHRRRAGLDEESLAIDVTEDLATTVFEVRFFRTRTDQEQLEWHARFRADWRRGDGGWEILRSGHENVSGQRPR